MTDEPIAIIEKNSAERIQVALSEYEGRAYLDVRLHFLPRDSNEWKPTRKGVTINQRKIPEMIAALQKAETAARAAGLLGDAPAVRGLSTQQDRQIDPMDAMSAG